MTRQEADRLKIGDRVRVTDLLGTSGDDDAQTGTVVENVPGLAEHLITILMDKHKTRWVYDKNNMANIFQYSKASQQ
jgi:hypothetical protein